MQAKSWTTPPPDFGPKFPTPLPRVPNNAAPPPPRCTRIILSICYPPEGSLQCAAQYSAESEELERLSQSCAFRFLRKYVGRGGAPEGEFVGG